MQNSLSQLTKINPTLSNRSRYELSLRHCMVEIKHIIVFINRYITVLTNYVDGAQVHSSHPCKSGPCQNGVPFSFNHYMYLAFATFVHFLKSHHLTFFLNWRELFDFFVNLMVHVLPVLSIWFIHKIDYYTWLNFWIKY